MKNIITIKDLSELRHCAQEFLDATKGYSIFAFYAPMGAGKTTFTTAICHQLGVKDDAVSSPTFSIVNEYRAANGSSIYHFDFYRINKIEEALDIGLFDYLDSGCLCIIEWPENIEALLPEEALRVNIRVNDDLSRSIMWDD